MGCTLVIPDDVKESVYNAYKDLTVEDFRERIRQEYLEAMGDLGGDANVICSIPDNTIISGEDISVSDWKDGNNADGAKTTFGEQPNYHIVNIVDRTKTEGLPYATAEEKFFEDGDNEYYFSGMYSHYVIVHYEDGSQEDIVTALNAGRATIADLDKFEVDYFVRALDAENVEPLSEQ